jgi:N-acetyl-anhydromuramyl-L-alanine amidase AmpD
MNTLHASPAPTFSIDDHILTGDNISFRLSPNTPGRFQSSSPDTIVIHFTAGSSLASSVNVLTNADSGVSAHFVVGRNGDIVQMLPTNKIAWHAGESHYEGRSGLNQYSIGIELDNAGQLKARGDGTYESWFGEVYGENEVLTAQHANQQSIGYWHKYTEVQIARTLSICKALCSYYDISTVVGHEEIAPARKVDPGPAFPLQKFKALVLQSESDKWARESSESSSQREAHDQIQRDLASPVKRVANVSANALNVRKGPDVSFGVVENGLNKGEVLKVLEKRGEWAKVSYTKVGWVNTKYINEITEKSPFKS